jgi:hypothetical protein
MTIEGIWNLCRSLGKQTNLYETWARKMLVVDARALTFKEGKGVVRDTARAAQLFIQAAELGNADAQNEAGNCYQFGKGVPANDEKAFYYFEQSCSQTKSKRFTR